MSAIHLAENLAVTEALTTMVATIQQALERNLVEEETLVCLAGATQTLWDLTSEINPPPRPEPLPGAAWESAPPDPHARWWNIDASVFTVCCGQSLAIDSGFREACPICGQVYHIVVTAHIERLRNYPPASEGATP